VLVVANETVAGTGLIDAVKAKAAEGDVELVTVLAPVTQPSAGYVVYEDTRRAAAGRRLDRTLAALREAGIPAHGLVVETEPDEAVRDSFGMLDPKPTDVILSTHPVEKSGWMRKNVVDRVRKAAGDVPVEHVVVDITEDAGATNVLVIANETVIGEDLLDRIRRRAAQGAARGSTPTARWLIRIRTRPRCRRSRTSGSTRSSSRRSKRRVQGGCGAISSSAFGTIRTSRSSTSSSRPKRSAPRASRSSERPRRIGARRTRPPSS
jgi:hypothetical protein